MRVPLAMERKFSAGHLLNGGRYRVVRELNQGATAVVYVAQDTSTGGYVALKVMHCPDQVPVKIVKREITLSSTVAHENIIRLLDVFAESNSQLVIAWELVNGPDLLELLNECGGRMTEDAAAFYFVQLLEAVLYLHASGFCHRDIKPENCMVEQGTKRLKLIDFGLSKHLDSVATLGVGTPDYMPPEMLQNRGSSTARVDYSRRVMAQGGATGEMRAQPPPAPGTPPYDAKAVDAWAMGVMLYLLVTGRYPFEDPSMPNNLARTVANVLRGNMQPLPPHISQECTGVIQALLQVSPDKRMRLSELARNPWLLGHATRFRQQAPANHNTQQAQQQEQQQQQQQQGEEVPMEVDGAAQQLKGTQTKAGLFSCGRNGSGGSNGGGGNGGSGPGADQQNGKSAFRKLLPQFMRGNSK